MDKVDHKANAQPDAAKEDPKASAKKDDAQKAEDAGNPSPGAEGGY